MSKTTTSMYDDNDLESKSIRVIKFNGEDDKWHEWSAKTQAVGTLKGWWDAVEGEDVDHTDKEAVEERERANEKAHHYLLLSCCDGAFPYVEGSNGNAKAAWNALKERFEASEAVDLVELEGEFSNFKPGNPYDSPNLWILELEYLRKRIENVGKTKMDESRMIAQIILKAPKEYAVPINVIQTSLKSSKVTLSEVKSALRHYWKTNLKGKKAGVNNSKNVALNSEHKKPWKKFKGYCKNCGKQGHKTHQCKDKVNKERYKGNVKKEKDMSKVKCFRCGQMGHYAKDCPKKDVETGLFVGMAVETKTEPKPFHEFYQKRSAERTQLIENKRLMKQKEKTSEWVVVNNNKMYFDVYPPEPEEEWIVMMADTSVEDKKPPAEEIINQDEVSTEEEQEPTPKKAKTEESQESLKIPKAISQSQGEGYLQDFDSEEDEEDEKDIFDMCVIPKWYHNNKWNNHWCVEVPKDHPGHPNQMKNDYKLESRPLIGNILGRIFVTEGDAPPDVTVQDWKKAQKELGLTITKQSTRWNMNPYIPHPGEPNWYFECEKETCNFSTVSKKWRNGFFCPNCNDYRVRTWLKDFKGFAHKDLFDDNDSNENEFCTYVSTCQETHIPKTTTEIPNSQSSSEQKESTSESEESIIWPERPYNSQSFIATSNNNINGTKEKEESWLLDSGATIHITNNKSQMFNIKTVENHVTIGDGSKIIGRIQGSILLQTSNQIKFKLYNVLYIPGFNRNILSLARILEKGNEITADSESMKLLRGASSLTLMKEHTSGMYVMKATRMSPKPWQSLHLAENKEEKPEKPKTVDINEAHDKLGHAYEQVIRRTCKRLAIKVTGTLLPCDACMRTKAKAKAVKKYTEKKATKVGE